MTSFIRDFLKTEAGGGFLLVATAVLALILANTAFSTSYFGLLKTELTLDLGVWAHTASVKAWVKDGLMAIFFYVIGLELKREITVGELSNPKTVAVPVIAAMGGVVAPIALYWLIAGSVDARGWPIPVATDIAFALAALAILAPRANPQLRLFLLTLAVVDDLLAIVLIGVLFSSGLDVGFLAAAVGLLLAVAAAGRFVALPLLVYPLVALACWALAVKAGVHTSIMAVAAALIVPIRRPAATIASAEPQEGLLERLEHALHPISARVVLPIFAFAAAGVSFDGLSLTSLTEGVPAGIAIGLALGKPIGVLAFAWLAMKAVGTRDGLTVPELVSIGCLCGIGFTMSLFIGGLAFAGDAAGETAAQIGVLSGSTLAVLLSILALKLLPIRLEAVTGR